MDSYPETPESIARAKADMDATRRAFEAQYPEYRITPDGEIVRQPDRVLRDLHLQNIADAVADGTLTWAEANALIGLEVGLWLTDRN